MGAVAGRPQILRVAACLFTSWMMSGCATIGLMEISDPDNRKRHTAEWSIRSIDSAHVNTEGELLVCLTGRAPRTARRSPYSFLVSLDSRLGTHSAAPAHPVDNADDTVPAPPTLTDARVAIDQQPPRRAERMTAKPRDIYAGWPDTETLAAQGWTRVPVRRSKRCSPACPDGCRARGPPAEPAAVGTVYYPVCEDPSAAFVFAAPNAASTTVRPEEFRYDGGSWIALRLFLPVTVAFDAVTSPIQGIILLYVLSTMSLF